MTFRELRLCKLFETWSLIPEYYLLGRKDNKLRTIIKNKLVHNYSTVTKTIATFRTNDFYYNFHNAIYYKEAVDLSRHIETLCYDRINNQDIKIPDKVNHTITYSEKVDRYCVNNDSGLFSVQFPISDC